MVFRLLNSVKDFVPPQTSEEDPGEVGLPDWAKITLGVTGSTIVASILLIMFCGCILYKYCGPKNSEPASQNNGHHEESGDPHVYDTRGLHT